MKRTTLWALPLLLAAPALAGPGATPPRRPATAAAALEAIGEAEQLLVSLIEKAKQDPRMARVERYLSWKTPEEFASPRRDVRVSNLVDWMADKEAPLSLRERAREALKSHTHRSLDPDLQISEGRSKRVAFSLNRLVPLLESKDEVSRTLSADVLDSYWHPSDPDIQRYNARPGNERSWAAAAAAYKRYLAAK